MPTTRADAIVADATEPIRAAHPARDQAIDQATDQPAATIFATAPAAGMATTLRVTTLTALAGTIALPAIWLAAVALSSPDVRALILMQPAVALQLAVALLFWCALILWPLRALVAAAAPERRIEIKIAEGGGRVVIVAEQHRRGETHHWSEPLSQYRGVARAIRSSLSGLHHELRLVHGNPEKSLLLISTTDSASPEIAALIRKLNVPEIVTADLPTPNETRSSPPRLSLPRWSPRDAAASF